MSEMVVCDYGELGLILWKLPFSPVQSISGLLWLRSLEVTIL